MDTTTNTPLATAGRILAGIALTIPAAVHACVWVLVAGLQCDESCDRGSWQGTPGAWQWSAMGWLGFASLLLAAAFAIALATRRGRRLTLGLLASAIATAIAPWIINAAG
jgi:hypothetical protein